MAKKCNAINLFDIIGMILTSIFILCPIVVFFGYFDFIGGWIIYFVYFLGMISLAYLIGLDELYYKSVKIATINPEIHSEDNHHGIIFPQYSSFFKQKAISDLIDILVTQFHKSKICYKIYFIENEDDFISAYSNPKCTSLWILGHGDRGGLKFGTDGYLP